MTTIVFEGVHDGPTSARIAGATVLFCVETEQDCTATNALAQGTTDVNGAVTLTVPTAIGNSNKPMGTASAT